MKTIIKYTYGQLVPGLAFMAGQIAGSGWTPTMIMGISRGGLIPAVMLSHCFNIPLYPYHISLRDHIREGHINFKLIWKHNVLVVDDICHTGEILRTIFDNIADLTSSVKFATLHYAQSPKFVPDYYLETINPGEWVEYPWENWWKSD